MTDMWEVQPEDKIREIAGTMTFADGEVVQFRLSYDAANQRWGNTDRVLGRAVLPCEEISEAISGEELSGRDIQMRRADCGAGCRCATEVRFA